jgi:hypothetical protein
MSNESRPNNGFNSNENHYKQILHEFRDFRKDLYELKQLIKGPDAGKSGEELGILHRIKKLESQHDEIEKQLESYQNQLSTIRKITNAALALWPIIIFIINYLLKEKL